MKIPTHLLLSALLILLMVPAGAGAQATDTTEMQAALQAVRERGSSWLATAFLSQERGPRSAEELEAFADSIVKIATAYQPGDPRSTQRAARGAFVSAAQGYRTVPYPHAFEALVRIYEGSREAWIRGSILWDMTQLPNKGPVLDFLIQVASSPELIAPTAIGYIVQEMGEAGLARLRRLYEDGTAENPIARERLEGLAHLYQWGGLR